MNEHDNKPNRDRVRSIFDEVADLAPTERAAALGRLCVTGDRADAALREEVEGLLASHDAARQGRFMTSPTAATTVRNAAIAETPGMRVGPYKLLQVIGEGGFGTVFLAEQTEPVRRRVALKIIKLGMDTKQVIARFEAERQALALMDHPHIARVLDAGATPITEHGGGRPYFVMEYVVGDAITQFAANNNLDLRARLELFAQVCSAVQHAHTKGIIHRDIKPGNVLVTMSDGMPFARVIDFGIAKATGGSGGLTDKTLFTEHRQLIGTPEYMSPEQAQGSPDIDTRTDVYALGVLLYELLAGVTPFDGKRLRSAAWDEMRRIIKEEEPPTPSVRVTQRLKSSGSASSPSVPPAPVGGCPSVPSDLRGELDWIVMKSLDKDRARRYETPSALAADVLCHLKGEAVTAAPPSAAYRLRKFVRRNKGPVIAGTAVAAALLVGIAGTTIGMWRASVAEAEATHQAFVAGRHAAAANIERLKAETQRDFAARSGRALLALLNGNESNTDLAFVRGINHAIGERSATEDGHGPWDPDDVAKHVGRDLSGLSALTLDTARKVIDAQEQLRRQTDAAEWSAYTANIFAALSDPYSRRRYLDACAEKLRNWEWDFLNASSDVSLLTLRVPGRSDVSWTRAGFVSGGTRVVACAGESIIATFDAKTGELLCAGDGADKVYDFTASQMSSVIAVNGSRRSSGTGSSEEFNEVWDAETLRKRFVLPGRGTVSPCGRWVHASAVIFDANSGARVAALDLHGRYGPHSRGAGFSEDGKQFITWGTDAVSERVSRVDVWDAESGRLLHSIEELPRLDRALAAGDALVTTHSFGYRVWDRHTMTHIRTFEADTGTSGDTLSSDGRYIYARPYNCEGRIYEVATGTLVSRLTDEAHGVYEGEFSEDASRIAAASGPFVCVWDVATGKRLAKLPGHQEGWMSVALSPDGTSILSRGSDGMARLWSATAFHVTKIATPEYRIYDNESTARRKLTNSTHVLATDWDGNASVMLIDVATGTVDVTIDVPAPSNTESTYALNDAFFSGDGRRVITRRGPSVRVWNAADGAPIREIVLPVNIDNPAIRTRAAGTRHGHLPIGDPVWLECDYQGSRLLALFGNGLARVYDATDGNILLEARGDGYPIGVLSPDGVVAAIAWEDHTIRLFDIASATQIGILSGHTDVVSQMAFDPSGKRLVTKSEDLSIRLWDLASGAQKVLFTGTERLRDPSSWLHSLWFFCGIGSFDHDRQRLALRVDGGCAIHDTITGELLIELKWHAWPINHAIFSPDGSRIFTSSLDNTIRVWESETGREVMVLRPDMGNESGFAVLDLSPDGTRLIARYAFDSTFHVFDTLPYQNRHGASK
ncbi:MAG: protein kinase [Phycisphaeraceae bacterium]|nr:MAG: protein kinase [Phycisphaeraceae bacterium]